MFSVPIAQKIFNCDWFSVTVNDKGLVFYLNLFYLNNCALSHDVCLQVTDRRTT